MGRAEAHGGDPPPKDRWLWVRLAGWGLIVLSQVMALLDVALHTIPLRVGGPLLAIAGVVLVAWGYERVFRNKEKRKSSGTRGGRKGEG